MATIRIPKIGVDKAVIQGVGVPDLKKGPGHYPSTPLPGQPGNAAIAGHRTTYGAPFYRLDELAPGDKILVATKQGHFEYKVESSKEVESLRAQCNMSKEGTDLWLKRKGELTIALQAAKTLRDQLEEQLRAKVSALSIL